MLKELINSTAALLVFFHPGGRYNNPAVYDVMPGRNVISGTVISDAAGREEAITDSNMSLAESLSGIQIPGSVKKDLLLIDVQYYSFDRKLHKGQMLVNKNLAGDLLDIFSEIKDKRFPIGKVIPIARYNWSDVLSMKDNNSSCFNYRLVEGTKVLSAHAHGRAIDINPMQNPQFQKGQLSPEGAAYNIKAPGTITRESFLVKSFSAHGWQWGGLWRSTRDYQHFEKK